MDNRSLKLRLTYNFWLSAFSSPLKFNYCSCNVYFCSLCSIGTRHKRFVFARDRGESWRLSRCTWDTTTLYVQCTSFWAGYYCMSLWGPFSELICIEHLPPTLILEDVHRGQVGPELSGGGVSVTWDHPIIKYGLWSREKSPWRKKKQRSNISTCIAVFRFDHMTTHLFEISFELF